ncbi:MAG: flagellar hook-length control protein FliK [Pseudomonadota bacterium]
MQTPTLPIQISGAGPESFAPKANGNSGGNEFAQALSREIDNRAPSPAKPEAAPQNTKQADKAPAPQDKPAAGDPAPAPANKADKGDADGKADSTASTAAAGKDSDAADAAAVTPMADMLALVASFNLAAPLASAPAKALADPAATVAVAAAPADAAALAAVPTVAEAAVAAAPALAAAAVADEGAAPAAGFTEQLKQSVAAAAAADPKAAAAVPAEASPTTALPQAAVGRPSAPRQAADDGLAPKIALKEGGRHIEAPVNTAKAAAPAADAKPDAAAQVAVETPAVQAKPAQAEPVPVSAVRAREAAPVAAAPKEAAVAAPVSAPQVQQASLQLAQAVAPTDRLAARVGTPAWDNQVGQKIVWMVAGGEQSASLTLNPPDLGPMQVVLNVHNDQASVTFSSAQPEVRQALESALPKLREMLGESGISLGNASVNAGMPNQQQQAQGEQPRFGGASGLSGQTDNGALRSVGNDVARPARRTDNNGLVDTFA